MVDPGGGRGSRRLRMVFAFNGAPGSGHCEDCLIIEEREWDR